MVYLPGSTARPACSGSSWRFSQGLLDSRWSDVFFRVVTAAITLLRHSAFCVDFLVLLYPPLIVRPSLCDRHTWFILVFTHFIIVRAQVSASRTHVYTVPYISFPLPVAITFFPFTTTSPHSLASSLSDNHPLPQRTSLVVSYLNLTITLPHLTILHPSTYTT
jgi:hypothetical protein